MRTKAAIESMAAALKISVPDTQSDPKAYADLVETHLILSTPRPGKSRLEQASPPLLKNGNTSGDNA
jgi:hypothetical protein